MMSKLKSLEPPKPSRDKLKALIVGKSKQDTATKMISSYEKRGILPSTKTGLSVKLNVHSNKYPLTLAQIKT